MVAKKIGLRIKQNYFAKSFLALLSGSVIAQIINLAFYPVISRVFSPRDFGDLAVFTSTIGVLSSFTSGKYELAIPTVRSIHASRRIVQLATSVSFLSSILVLIGVLVYLLGFGKHKTLTSTQSGLLLLLPLSVIMINGYQVLSYFFIKYKKLKLIFRTKLTQVIYKNAVQVGGGLLFQNKVFFLGLGVIMSQSVGLFTLVLKYIKERTTKKSFFPDKRTIGLLVGYGAKYKKYPFYSMPSALLNKFGAELPVFFLTALYSTTFTGYYSMANQLIAIPVSIVIQSLSQTYLNEIAAKFLVSKKDTLKFYKKFNVKLFKWTLLPCLLAALIIKPVAIFILGSKWETAAEIMQYLCVLSYFQLVYSTISQTLNIINKHEKQLVWNIARLIAVAALFSTAAYFKIDSLDLIKLFVGVMIIFYLILGRITTVALNKEAQHG